METYRSGHNENDSKSFGRLIPARGFESHRLRLYIAVFGMLPQILLGLRQLFCLAVTLLI